MAFAEDGYEVVSGVLPAPAVCRLREGLDSWLQGRTGGIARCRRGVLACPAVRESSLGPELSRLVRLHGGRDARPVRAILFDKSAEANWRVGWHQDLVTAFGERVDAPGYSAWSEKDGVAHARPPVGLLERMVTVRLQLDDCGPENGPLEVLPGTHLRGELSTEAVRDAIAYSEPIACTAAVGDALVMRPLLLHASAKATTPSRRRVLHLEYAFEDPPGGAAWPDWQE